MHSFNLLVGCCCAGGFMGWIIGQGSIFKSSCKCLQVGTILLAKIQALEIVKMMDPCILLTLPLPYLPPPPKKKEEEEKNQTFLQMQENESFSLITWTSQCICCELSFEWPHLLVSFARKWTFFSNNTNSTIRMYSSWAFIWVISPFGFVCKKINSLQ